MIKKNPANGSFVMFAGAIIDHWTSMSMREAPDPQSRQVCLLIERDLGGVGVVLNSNEDLTSNSTVLWCNILFAGRTGWVPTMYLREINS